MAISKITFVSTLLILFTCSLTPSLANYNITPPTASSYINVLRFGAKPDGVSNSTEGFLGAWAAACASSNTSVIYVPRGRYVVERLSFKGDDCLSPKIGFKIDGTLVGPADYRVLGKDDKWISFERVKGVSIVGGRLDAGGPALWACKSAAASSGANCPDGATTLSFINSKDIKIIGLLSLNSQMFHIVIHASENVILKGVNIIAHRDSPNTDGIHVSLSTNVVIRNCTIRTGDDCISIGPGTNGLWMESIVCGPGHGISIGSLGKDLEEQGVQNVTVKNANFIGTDNGLRIKTWANPSNGFVQGVQFLDVTMKYVKNPILIDQNYCPRHTNCPNQVSGIKISDVVYRGIQGTSATPIAIKFDCSAANPCSGIELNNVNLSCLGEAAQSSCSNVNGKAYGTVQPNSCL